MRRTRRGADTRNKVLDVAEQVFARNGFAGAHLQQIAEQVGVQKTALYYYYPSKAALYESVLVRMLDAFDQAVSNAIDVPESPASRLERLIDALNDLLSEQRNYSQILIRIFVDRVEIEGVTLRPLIERFVGRLLAFYREGVDANAFAKLSSRHLFQSLLGASVFHYATGEFGAQVLGVDDIFTQSAVAWRREEVRRLVLRGVLRSETRDDGS
jgi:TetR/AcrR family transcriptional regulator